MDQSNVFVTDHAAARYCGRIDPGASRTDLLAVFAAAKWLSNKAARRVRKLSGFRDFCIPGARDIRFAQAGNLVFVCRVESDLVVVLTVYRHPLVTA